MLIQGQTTILQQQPNGLLIQSQALASQTGSQPGALHRQLSSQQIGNLQQQVKPYCILLLSVSACIQLKVFMPGACLLSCHDVHMR